MPQLWQGRASKAVDSRVNDFNSSIRFDARMIEQDIQGSLVHSSMLGRQGIISQQDVDDIHKGLHSILVTCTPVRWRSTPTPRMYTPLWSRPLPPAWAMPVSGCTPAAAATTR